MANERLVQLKTMAKSTASVVVAWYKRYRPWIFSGLTIISILLIVWARFGFTFEVSQFFAYQCTPDSDTDRACSSDGTTVIECDQTTWIDIEDCSPGTCSGGNCVGTTQSRKEQGGCAVAAHPTLNCCLDPGNISCVGDSRFQHYNAGTIWGACNGETLNACEFGCEGAPNATCKSAPVSATHLACRNNACVAVDGSGSDQCGDDSECAPTTHLDCRNNACVTVSGGGADLCSSNTDCAPIATATHLACQNNACVVVTGTGTNECSTDAECGIISGPIHLACQNNACVVVTGTGTNECSTDAECAETTSPLECAPASQTISLRINEEAGVSFTGAILTAAGGVGVKYVWTAPSGNPSNGEGDSFSVTYSAAGTYNVSVVDIGGAGDEELQPTATCTVVVQEDTIACTADAKQCSDGSLVGRVPPNCEFAACPVEPTPTITPPQAVLILNSEIRNFTEGGSYAPQAVGRSSQQFQVRLFVDAGTNFIPNVILKASLPNTVTYMLGSTLIDGQLTSVDAITEGGLAIGTLSGSQQVTFTVAVKGAGSLPSGTLTSIMPTMAAGDGVAAVSAAVTMIIDNAPFVAEASEVPTGPGDVMLLALMSAALLTLLYVSYTYTHLYRSREVGTITKRRDPLNFK